MVRSDDRLLAPFVLVLDSELCQVQLLAEREAVVELHLRVMVCGYPFSLFGVRVSGIRLRVEGLGCRV